MTCSVRHSRAPIFFFQAENDLSGAIKEAGKELELKIYPLYGKSVQDGHTFGCFGGSIWADDVFCFLAKHCGK